jgi:hypothetical protein
MEELESVQPKHGGISDVNTNATVFHAIRGLGTNCIPALLDRLNPKRERMWDRPLMDLSNYMVKHGVPATWSMNRLQDDRKIGAAIHGFFVLGEAGAPAIPALHARLIEPENTLAKPAAIAMVRLGPQGIQTLLKELTHSDPLVRDAAAYGLTFSTTKRLDLLRALLGQVHNPYRGLRSRVAVALSGYGDWPEAALGGIAALADDPDEHVRINALWSLENLLLRGS